MIKEYDTLYDVANIGHVIIEINVSLNSLILYALPGLGNLILNSLAPEKFEWNLIYVIFKLILFIMLIAGWGICLEIALMMDYMDPDVLCPQKGR